MGLPGGYMREDQMKFKPEDFTVIGSVEDEIDTDLQPSFSFGVDLNPLYAIESGLQAVKSGIHDLGHTLEGIPGGNIIVKAADQGAQWVHDIAKTDMGNIVLRALSLSLGAGILNAYRPLPPLDPLQFLGQQAVIIASFSTIALQGMARGEGFTQAWTQEALWRVAKTAEVAGPSVAESALKSADPAIKVLIDKAKSQIPKDKNPFAVTDEITEAVKLDEALQKLNITPEQLANELGIRVDIAALAIEYAKGKLGLFNLDEYDLKTGSKRTIGAGRQVQYDFMRKAESIGTGGAMTAARRGYTLPKPVSGIGKVKRDPKTGKVVSGKSVKKKPGTITPASGIGAAGGATAGFFVAGPVGALIGGILGFLGGHAVSK